MLRLAEHALRQEMPAYALAAAESARQFWQVSDPIRGVGHALAVQVKALAALRKWPAVVTLAHARAVLAGQLQPNAIEVRDFYRTRSPAGLLAEIDRLDSSQLDSKAEIMTEALLAPMLRQLDLDFQSLGVPGGALAVTSALASATPSPHTMRAGPTPVAVASEALPQPTQMQQEDLERTPAPLDRGDYSELYRPPTDESTIPEDGGDEPPPLDGSSV
jgi:hypothetical protein